MSPTELGCPPPRGSPFLGRGAPDLERTMATARHVEHGVKHFIVSTIKEELDSVLDVPTDIAVKYARILQVCVSCPTPPKSTPQSKQTQPTARLRTRWAKKSSRCAQLAPVSVPASVF